MRTGCQASDCHDPKCPYVDCSKWNLEEIIPEDTIRDRYDDLIARMTPIRAQLSVLEAEIAVLQDECEHTFASFKHGANTGNYDPSADCYWTTWSCGDCGKRWTTDQ